MRDEHIPGYIDYLKDHIHHFGAIPGDYEAEDGTIYDTDTCFQTAWKLANERKVFIPADLLEG